MEMAAVDKSNVEIEIRCSQLLRGAER